MNKEFITYLQKISKLGLSAKNKRLELLEKKSILDPLDVDIRLNLTLFYIAVEDFDNALKAIKSAILLNPVQHDLWFIQAYIYESRSKYQFAFDTYYKAYRLGSMAAKEKLKYFCNNMKDRLTDSALERINEFSNTIC